MPTGSYFQGLGLCYFERAASGGNSLYLYVYYLSLAPLRWIRLGTARPLSWPLFTVLTGVLHRFDWEAYCSIYLRDPLVDTL